MGIIRKAEETLSGQFARHWTATKLLMAAGFTSMAAISGRNKHYSLATGASALVQSFRTFTHMGVLKDYLYEVNAADDKVDRMFASQRLALGEAKEGTEPSPLLLHPDMRMQKYFAIIDRLDASGVMSREEEISFSNIYARLIRQGAQAEQAYLNTGNTAHRREATETNMKVAQVLGAHILHHFKPDRVIREKSKQGTLHLEDVLAAYPEAMEFGYLLEMEDDLRDFFTDLEDEAFTGIITPNCLVTALDEKNQLYGPDKKLRPVLVDFIREQRQNPKPISFYDLPGTIKVAVNDTEEEHARRAAHLPALYREFANFLWQVNMKQGMRTNAHPDLAHKASQQVLDPT